MSVNVKIKRETTVIEEIGQFRTFESMSGEIAEWLLRILGTVGIQNL
jgi:hypothetical protein